MGGSQKYEKIQLRCGWSSGCSFTPWGLFFRIYTLEEANIAIKNFINKCFSENVTKIIVITGKGLRSKNIADPYLSKDLSILKYSVPEFVENNKNLMKMIIEITDAKIEDGGSGAFYIYIKNKFKLK